MENRLLMKEGFMEKKKGILKTWKNRYYVLFEHALTYFMKEEQKDTTMPAGRIFISDITDVERIEKKGRPFCMIINTDAKKHSFSCRSYQEREEWILKLLEARDNHMKQESADPVRRRSTRLGKEYKRITIKKDPQHGIGCTIKNVGGAIFVSRIIADGPVATTGVLRPGDQIIDINGTRVSHTPIEQIKEIIRSSPDYIVSTVKPVTHYSTHDESPQLSRTAYTTVDPSLLREELDETPYTSIRYDTQSVDNDEHVKKEDDTSVSEHYDDMNDTAVEYERIHSVEQDKKATSNYAELEFGARR